MKLTLLKINVALTEVFIKEDLTGFGLYPEIKKRVLQSARDSVYRSIDKCYTVFKCEHNAISETETQYLFYFERMSSSRYELFKSFLNGLKRGVVEFHRFIMNEQLVSVSFTIENV